jgi:hypothetical protein
MPATVTISILATSRLNVFTVHLPFMSMITGPMTKFLRASIGLRDQHYHDRLQSKTEKASGRDVVHVMLPIT